MLNLCIQYQNIRSPPPPLFDKTCLRRSIVNHYSLFDFIVNLVLVPGFSCEWNIWTNFQQCFCTFLGEVEKLIWVKHRWSFNQHKSERNKNKNVFRKGNHKSATTRTTFYSQKRNNFLELYCIMNASLYHLCKSIKLLSDWNLFELHRYLNERFYDLITDLYVKQEKPLALVSVSKLMGG